MPLTNEVIIQLNEITTMVEDKKKISESEIDAIKKIFHNILKSGQMYDVEDVESWFENEGSWHDKNTISRITNLSHYVQSKHEQNNPFKMVSDNDDCSCDS